MVDTNFIEYSMRTAHIKNFNLQNSLLVSGLVRLVKSLSWNVFTQHTDSVNRYLLPRDDGFYRAFIGMYFTLGCCKNPLPTEVSIITNINEVKDFHIPCLNKIRETLGLGKSIPEEWEKYLFKLYDDPDFNRREFRSVVKPHKNKPAKFIFHYTIGRFNSSADFMVPIPELMDQIDIDPDTGEQREPHQWTFNELPFAAKLTKAQSYFVTLTETYFDFNKQEFGHLLFW